MNGFIHDSFTSRLLYCILFSRLTLCTGRSLISACVSKFPGERDG